jgi:DNA-binding NarL/FixJ family response regulator
MTSPLTLLLIDDQPIVFQGLKALMEDESLRYTVRRAASRQQAIDEVMAAPPALALVEIMLPDGDGIELIREFKQLAPACPVLVFSTRCELLFGPRALKAGARGYVMKNSPVATLAEAIRQIEAGRIFCSQSLTEQMMRAWRDVPARGISALTEREFQVFRLLGEGRSTKVIAGTMGIRVKTVESHRENMKLKLGCANGTELLLLARDWLRSPDR